MKLWLVSYPRSGNTFIRIILDRVYSTESYEYIDFRSAFTNLRKFKAPVIKTHLLPNQIFPKSAHFPIVYLVRDGRDTLVSLAHHTIFLREEKSSYYKTLLEVISASKGSYFGRWNYHVHEWIKRANIVIRYEDLIKDPIETVENFRRFIDLPQPNEKKLPTFEELKNHTGRRISKSVGIRLENKKFFRRGISGAWKDEMPNDLHRLFWRLHGDGMIKLGYTEGMLA